jgi:hypothetical protein
MVEKYCVTRYVQSSLYTNIANKVITLPSYLPSKFHIISIFRTQCLQECSGA